MYSQQRKQRGVTAQSGQALGSEDGQGSPDDPKSKKEGPGSTLRGPLSSALQVADRLPLAAHRANRGLRVDKSKARIMIETFAAVRERIRRNGATGRKVHVLRGVFKDLIDPVR